MAPALVPVPIHAPCEPTEHACPTWCRGRADEEPSHSHESVAVEWLGPAYLGSRYDTPALSAAVALLEEDDEDGTQPEIWLGANGAWTELDLPQFESVIAELEEYTVALRALKYRYAAILAGRDISSQDAYAAGPKHPVEITSLCPAWCRYREEGHSDGSLLDRFHCGEEQLVELSLHRPSDGVLGPDTPDEIEVSLEQPPYRRLPRLAFTIQRDSGGFCNLSLPEARQLRGVLGELIAQAEQCAAPEALPLLETVTAHMRAKVVEDPQLDSQSRGYALADTDPDGKVWVCIPPGLSSGEREETIRDLLAGGFEAPNWAKSAVLPGAPLHVTGDRSEWVKATARAAA
ncbi:DUF6907 domain-containing protein [Streptomyces sp. NPDC057430]